MINKSLTKALMEDRHREHDLERQLKRALRSIRIWRRRALNANDWINDGVYHYKPGRWDGEIEDGFENVWSAVCPNCGGDMRVMRPGDARCSRECWNEWRIEER